MDCLGRHDLPEACPFNSGAYLSGLPHLGDVVSDPSAPSAILRRAIPGTSRFDGLGPWPYMWVDGARQLADFEDAFPELVTVAALTQPGFRPAGKRSDPVRLRDHYIYDPALAFPELSRRTRDHVRRAEEVWEFDLITGLEERLAIVTLYDGLRKRRGLAGGFFDFPRAHFETLARLPGAVFFRVRNGETAAAIACAIAFGGWIQLLHIAISDEGLRRDASYLLMMRMMELAKRDGRLLLLGGIPRDGDEGLARFKTRWSNRTEPIFLLRIVNDAAAYADLADGREHRPYFPAYRD